MTEAEWLVSEFPFDMLRHLDGKIDDEEFMRFSVACCQRIWKLISDERSKAVIEATEAYLKRAITAEQAGRICAEWTRAYEAGEVQDLAGGATNDAIESVCGLGYGHAAQVARACSVFGENRAYHISIIVNEVEQSWMMFGPEGEARVEIGGNFFPKHQMCFDPQLARQVVRFFLDRGEKLPTVTWFTDVIEY